jgi:hypothetical protein
MRFLLGSLVVFFAACSSELNTQNTPPIQLPSLPPLIKKEALTQSSSTQSTSAQSTSTSAPAKSDVVLSDLMLLVRNNGAPLLLNGERGRAAELKMEKLFFKIREAAPASAPDDWKDAWFAITESAIAGKPDALGRRPWNIACKKCHDTYRADYKKKYHTRTIPITLDDVK